MVSELLIAWLVLILGAYWFRYNCLSILKTKSAPERAQNVAAANELNFPEVEKHLARELSAADLATLNGALLRDYQVLTCLLRYTSATAYTVEERMLMLDFQVMQWRFGITRRIFRKHARRSLGECTRILNHFAQTMSERSASLQHV